MEPRYRRGARRRRAGGHPRGGGALPRQQDLFCDPQRLGGAEARYPEHLQRDRLRAQAASGALSVRARPDQRERDEALRKAESARAKLETAEDDLLSSNRANDRLRKELGQKPTQVVTEKTNTREVRVDNLYVVTFAQGSSELTAEAKYALNGIREGAHVQIVGTASPEGGAEWNQQLSQDRADVVANYLKSRAVVVDEAVGRGVQGTTSNRLAVVFVK